MPPVCLQAANGNSGGPIGVEDCLYMVLYVPLSNSVISSGLPVLTWVHGGSFIEGSASNPGLDGSSLAKATNSVVAVVQYRLGVVCLHHQIIAYDLTGHNLVRLYPSVCCNKQLQSRCQGRCSRPAIP